MSRFLQQADSSSSRKQTLAQKFSLILVLTTGLAITLTAGVFTAGVAIKIYQDIQSQLLSLAMVISQNSQAALLFGDQDNAEKTLSALQAKPEINAAFIYDAKGELFASYTAPSLHNHDAMLMKVGPFIEALLPIHLQLEQPIIQGSEAIGHIVLYAEIYSMWVHLGENLLIVISLSLVSMLLAIQLGLRLSKTITEPIMELARAANRVTENEDYGILATSSTYEEIAVLIGNFNFMLDEIRLRDNQLHRQQEHLEWEVKERTAELIYARDAAEAANRAKSDFLANMSHEIRTPMNAVIGIGYLMSRTQLTKKQRNYLNTIKFSSENLLRIINDILDLSKIEAGKLDMERTDFHLDTVLNNLVDLFTNASKEKNVDFILSCAASVPHTLVGDSLRLGQVLINLAGNALKFTDSGEVVIAIDVQGETKNEILLRFSVRDTGIGMNEEQISALFQPFSQADSSTTRRFGGTGLGLAISKRLVELMEGEIGVASRSGQGSEFFFTANFGKSSAVVQRAAIDNVDNYPHRILVVCDELTECEALCSLLADFHLNTQVAVSGGDAVEVLARSVDDVTRSCDLVLMDRKLADRDGLEAIRRIRDDSRLCGVSILMMATSFEAEELLNRPDHQGFDGILLKPFTRSGLQDTVMSALEKPFLNRIEFRPIEPTVQADIKWGVLRFTGHVLLVEDNDINQQVAQEILEGIGLTVSIAANGQEAVGKVESSSFDLVLMDIDMPVMDGYEATAIIRLRLSFDELPIIAMTANTTSEHRERRLAVGMNNYIAKPINLEVLYRILGQWLAKKEAETSGALTGEAPRMHPAELAKRQAILPETITGVDLPAGLVRLRQNQTLYRKLLLEFQRDYYHTVDHIEVAIAEGKTDNAKRMIHAVKGVAGNLGMTGLFKAATNLEESLKRGETKQSLFAIFQNHFDQIMIALTELQERSRTARKPEPEFVAEALSPLLAKLAAYLSEGNPRAVDVLANIKECLGGMMPEQMEKLEAEIDNFDFEAADRTLMHLQKQLSENTSL